jgi:quinol monooxygenase YgiN
METTMREETKREYYWVVEVTDNSKVVFRKEYHDKEGKAFKAYNSLKSNGTVSIQRKWYDRKVA